MTVEIDGLVDENPESFNLADYPSNPRKRRISSVTSSGWNYESALVLRTG